MMNDEFRMMNRQKRAARRTTRMPSAALADSSFTLHPSSFRPAFTLIELMLVLTVIGVLAAVAWPSVLRLQADHELSSAAEQVRQLLAQARMKSIHTGLAYQFRFEPNGQRMCVVPFENEQPTVDATTTGTQTTSPVPRFSSQLPKTIAFALATTTSLSNVGTLPGQKLPDTAFQGLPEVAELAAVEWSAPQVFLPEGTSQDATLTLADRRGHRIDVQVRGLTGAATIGPMRQEAVR
jgi:prepilin-type N-terminal cleavage/methylation domain-containing protein